MNDTGWIDLLQLEERQGGMTELTGVASHHDREVAELRADRELAVNRESLYRALSPNGNPTLKTLLAVLKTVGMRLSVEPERDAAA
jgi:probable addiction module antidote protein